MNKNIYVAIIAGGSGTRLWPASRKKTPKQLQKLLGDYSSLQEMFSHAKKLTSVNNIYVITTADQANAIKKQIPQVKNVISEPEGKNTAMAIGLAATYIHALNPNATMVSLWADHHIANEVAFKKAIELAVLAANTYPDKLIPDYLITVGINPTEPNTGLGYIHKGEPLKKVKGVYKVKRFMEKPDLKTAEKFVSSGEYCWNTGYFVSRTETILRLFRQHTPIHYQALSNIALSIGSHDEKKVMAENYKKVPNEPIDTLIVEKTDKILVVPAEMGWSDIGSWATLYDVLRSKYGQNVAMGTEHLSIDSQGVLVHGHGKLIATVGVSDLAIIDTPDAILVCKKGRAQDVKKIVEELKRKGYRKYL